MTGPREAGTTHQTEARRATSVPSDRALDEDPKRNAAKRTLSAAVDKRNTEVARRDAWEHARKLQAARLAQVKQEFLREMAARGNPGRFHSPYEQHPGDPGSDPNDLFWREGPGRGLTPRPPRGWVIRGMRLDAAGQWWTAVSSVGSTSQWGYGGRTGWRALSDYEVALDFDRIVDALGEILADHDAKHGAS